LFGLSPRCTNFMNLLTKFVQLVLPTFASLDCLIHACVCLNSRHSFRYIFFCLEFIDTYVFACARHLAFILHTRWTCMSRFQSLDRDESFRGDQSGAAEVWKAVAVALFFQPHVDGLSRFFLPLVSIYQFSLFVYHFVNHTFALLGDVIIFM